MDTRHFVRAGLSLIAFFLARDAHAVIATPLPSPKTGLLGGPASSSSTSAAQTDVPLPPSAPEADPTLDMLEQARAGRTAPYARAGVLELGGFANFSGASNFTSIQVSPTAGLFLFDNFELSAIIGLNYVHQTFQAPSGDASDHKTVIRILGEPSYHIPLSRKIWGFLGVGFGVASVPRGAAGASAGFDIATRIGANFLVGRSGLFSPALFVDYTSGSPIRTASAGLLGVSTTYGIQAGYTVMW